MKKLICFTTGLVVFMVFLAPAILALGIKLIPGGDQPGFDYNLTRGVYGKRDITQKFISQKANLVAIGTSIKNPNLTNKKDIILTLFDENMKPERTAILNGQNIEDGSLVKFVFDPIPDSENKTYIFTLSSPTADPPDMIEVFLNQDLPGWIVNYTYDQVVSQGGMPIVIYYKPVNKWEVIKEIYSNLFSRLLPQSFYKS